MLALLLQRACILNAFEWRAVCHAPRRRPILVIGPASVLANWQREFATWGAFRTAVYHGGSDARAAALQGILQGRTEVLITSSATYRCAASWHAVFEMTQDGLCRVARKGQEPTHYAYVFAVRWSGGQPSAHAQAERGGAAGRAVARGHLGRGARAEERERQDLQGRHALRHAAALRAHRHGHGGALAWVSLEAWHACVSAREIC